MNVAIVGAGVAGAGAAFALRESAARVTVFEATDSVGGRAATRRRRGCTYDPGANYLKADDERVASLVRDEFAEGLVNVEEPVWTFDADGDVAEGDDREAHKWSYEAGLARLAERLLARSGANVHGEVRVTDLAREDGRWRLDGEETSLGRFDRVVLTPPAPETAALLDGSDWDGGPRDALVDALRAVPYRTIASAVLHYPFALERPYYALVNVDGEHAVSWVAREECKRGHVPDGESLLVAQMAHDWVTERLDDPPAEACADAATLVAGVLDDDRLADPDWTDYAGWRHALVDEAVDRAPLDDARAHGLAVAGDWVAGEARVHAALRTGLEAGDRLG